LFMTAMMLQSALVSAQTAGEWHASGRAVFLDATYFLGKPAQAGYEHYLTQRIPTARFFAIDAVADEATPLPHMLPSVATMAQAATALAITPQMTLVVYDGQGMFSAPRVWWTLRQFGFGAVYVLNGGLPAWQQASLPTEQGPPGPFDPLPQPVKPEQLQTPAGVATQQNIRAFVSDPTHYAAVIDARAADRFNGWAPEPRPGLQQGHIPGSVNVPWPHLLDPATQTLLPVPQLQALLTPVVAPNTTKSLVCTCGSGMTACLLALALHEVQAANPTTPHIPVHVYDGSWAEWGAIPANNPVAITPPLPVA
jgi:thiosulfate/3-mercaptopyruvate sulfurtransferase